MSLVGRFFISKICFALEVYTKPTIDWKDYQHKSSDLDLVQIGLNDCIRSCFGLSLGDKTSVQELLKMSGQVSVLRLGIIATTTFASKQHYLSTEIPAMNEENGNKTRLLSGGDV